MNRFEEDKAMNENEAAAQPGDGIDRRNFLGCMAWVSTYSGRWLVVCPPRSYWRRR
jgi:hypothetical protein